MSRRRLFTVLLTAATAVLILLVFTDWLSILRGPAPDTAVWHWNYRLRPVNRWWAALLAALFIFFTSVRPDRFRKPVRSWGMVTAVSSLALGSFLLQLGLIYADRPHVTAELVDRTLAVQTNGYYWTAVHITDLNTVLRDYPAAMTQFESDHARTHPPGMVVANWLTIAALERAPNLSQTIARAVRPLRCADLWLLNQPDPVVAALGIWAFLPLVLAATAVFPAYALAYQLANRQAAILAAAMTAALPALLIFAPLSDQLYPFLTLLILIALHRGLTQQRRIWIFGAGVLLSLSSFLTLGNAALLLVVVLFAAIVIWQTPTVRQKSALWLDWGLAFGIGAASIWLIYWLGWSVPPWEIAQAGIGEHVALVVSKRSYGGWLLFNLVDVLIFIGLPILAGFAGSVFEAVRSIGRRKISSASALALSIFLLIVVLDVSGSARGEVGRIWLFWMPLTAVTGAIFLAKQSTRKLWLGLQLALTLSVGLSWGTVGATIMRAERPSQSPQPAMTTPLNVSFGDTITLDGYALDIRDKTLDLTLLWQASDPAERPYTVFNHLLNDAGELVAQQDNWSVNGQWPPTCWQSGEQITDNYTLILPANLPSGAYNLYTGLYDAKTGTRLLTQDGRDAILLKEITLQNNN